MHAPFSLCSSTVAPPPLYANLFTLLLICLGVSLQTSKEPNSQTVVYGDK
jgi:hypothetical protein